jgi:hypothetical protein
LKCCAGFLKNYYKTSYRNVVLPIRSLCLVLYLALIGGEGDFDCFGILSRSPGVYDPLLPFLQPRLSNAIRPMRICLACAANENIFFNDVPHISGHDHTG